MFSLTPYPAPLTGVGLALSSQGPFLLETSSDPLPCSPHHHHHHPCCSFLAYLSPLLLLLCMDSATSCGQSLSGSLVIHLCPSTAEWGSCSELQIEGEGERSPYLDWTQSGISVIAIYAV